MIIDFKDNLDYNLDDFKVIFAPNSSGKTIYAESFIDITNTKENTCINKWTINNFLANHNIIDNPTFRGDSWNLGISKSPFLSKEQIIRLNDLICVTGARINLNNLRDKNELELKNLELIKSRKKAKFGNTSIEKMMREIGLSASEIETILIYIFMTAYSNVSDRIILDDPIEYASFEFEDKFVNFIEELNDVKITILTHRAFLFNRLLSLRKHFRNKKKIANFFYFLDDWPYLVESSSSSFFRELINCDLPKVNEMFKRDLYEKTKSNMKSLGYEEGNPIYDEIKKGFDDISKSKDFDPNYESNLMSDDLILAISAKRDCLNHMRQLLISEISSKENDESIKTLKKIDFEKYGKKVFVQEEVRFFQRILNSINHGSSDWIMFNEIRIKNILSLIQKNVNIRRVNTICLRILNAMEERYKKAKYDNYRMKFVFDGFYEITNQTNEAKLKYGRERSLMIFDGDFFEVSDGGGPLEWDDLKEFLNIIYRNAMPK